MTILIKNGSVVTADKVQKADVFLKDGKIACICTSCTEKAEKEIDAKGKHVFAGFVDMHCHLREPGFEYKETVKSGARAAAAGGFTSICCMPNTQPVLDNAPLISFVKQRGIEAGFAKVYPVGAITKGQAGAELAEMASMAKAGAVAFSDDGKPVENGGLMKLALDYADTFGLLLISHAEDKSIAGDGVVNEGYHASVAGLKGISRVAEEAMIARDILLAEAAKARVHIAHVSTKGGVELIRQAKKRGVRVTCETCPHYFCATDKEILSYNTNAKINPPLREPLDVDAIIQGIKDGTIDAIATDHAPHGADEKNREFDLAPFGTSGFETAFSLSYTYLAAAGHIDLPKLSKLLSGNPCAILGLNGGILKEGAPADIVIADLNKSITVDAQKFVSKGKNCLFDGAKLKGAVETVIIDGKLIKKFPS
ncbi:MAG: dihydroorotase [Firmicutes bacterium]|nr:dihydroorotase [Bacillota bacterium]